MKKILFEDNANAPIYFGIILIPTCIYLGAFGSLCVFTDWFTIWWLIFGFFLVFPITSAIAFALCILVPLNNSPEGKKAAGKIAVESIFQWLCYDFCYLSIFNNWTVPMYILGIISIVLMFIETINTFLINRKKLSLLFIFELLVGIALTIYLIYKIPDDLGNLQTIITTIIAALFGGLFTLLGVAWTIRKGEEDRKKDREQLENDRKEEERKKAIPYLQYFVKRNDDIQSVSAGGFTVKYFNDKVDHFRDFHFKNISDNIFVSDSVIIGDKLFNVDRRIVAKNQYVTLRIIGNIDELNKAADSFYLVGRDTLDNYYSYRMVFTDNFTTCLELPKEINKTDLEKLKEN